MRTKTSAIALLFTLLGAVSCGGSANDGGGGAGGSGGGAPGGGPANGGGPSHASGGGGASKGGGGSATCDADLLSDPDNCGRCGHACGGSTCLEGVCQPIELNRGFVGFDGPASFAFDLDATDVYLTNWRTTGDGGSELIKVPKAGGASVKLAEAPTPDKIWIFGLAASTSDPALVDVTFGSLNANAAGWMGTVPKAGGAPVTLESGLDLALASTLLARGDRIYFAAQDPAVQYTDAIFSRPAAGGPVKKLIGGITDNGSGGAMPGFVVDATHVYTSTFSYDAGQKVTANVVRAPLAGGPSEVFWSATHPWAPGALGPAFDYVAALAIDDDAIYFTRRGSAGGGGLDGLDNGEVWRVTKSARKATKLASGQLLAGGIAVDDRAVYWLSYDGLQRVPKTGGGIDRLGDAAGGFPNSGPFDVGVQIATDDRFVYWVRRLAGPGVNSFLGVLYKVAK